ncbi:MAG: pyrroline-5-carboxylate reductase [Thermodesulfobacteriota bacterium]
MGLEHLTIGFIGAGNMASALVGGLLRAKAARPENILASDADQDRLSRLGKETGIVTVPGNALVFSGSDICLLCVKPGQIEGVLREIAASEGFPGEKRKIILSIAAGIRIAKMEAVVYKGLQEKQKASLPIFRVMPNTPALVGSGVSAVAGNAYAGHRDMDIAASVLRAAGRVLTLPEASFDAVTAVSGSGPAYVFYLAEAMIRAAQNLGLSPDQARELAVSTVEGAGKLLAAGDTAPEVLRARVTSPGGTTQAAITEMEKRGVFASLVSAIEAAAHRSRELSGP